MEVTNGQLVSQSNGELMTGQVETHDEIKLGFKCVAVMSPVAGSRFHSNKGDMKVGSVDKMEGFRPLEMEGQSPNGLKMY